MYLLCHLRILYKNSKAITKPSEKMHSLDLNKAQKQSFRIRPQSVSRNERGNTLPFSSQSLRSCSKSIYGRFLQHVYYKHDTIYVLVLSRDLNENSGRFMMLTLL